MTETLRHKEAFEYYYSLGEKRNLIAVAHQCSVSERTVATWSKEFNWQFRVQQRDIENSKNLEKKTNKEVIDAKADFRKTIFAVHQLLKKSLNEFIKSNDIVQIAGIKGLLTVVIILDRLARLDMGLAGEPVEGGKELNVNDLGDLFAKIAEYERIFKDDKQGKSNISGNDSGKQMDSSQADSQASKVPNP